MTVTAVRKDPEQLTMTLDAEFDASPERVWQLWADPRQLERWWGPPMYPATVTSHDLRAGGRVEYHMTGPTGDQPRGWWQIVDADPPRRLSFRDGFSDADGRPNNDMPMNEVRVTITELGAGRTKMTIASIFPDRAAMEQLLAMGMEPGLTEAVGQIDAILAEDATRTLEVPGATLTYDVRLAATPTSEPPLVLIGSPMGAGGFATLAGHFADRTVVTYDPRGNGERSAAHDPSQPITPEVQAEDVHRIIEAVGGAPVDLFASSGGAIVAFALVAAHPGDVRTLVAHEPPLASLTADSEHALAVNRAINTTYQRSGWGAGMAHFITVVSHRGLFTADDAAAPPPDPAMFGMPAGDDGKRTDLMLGHSVLYLTSFEPDFDALRAAPTRIVVGVGEASDGELAHRGGEAAASRLGVPATAFPGDHGGFLGGEYGQTGQPDAFAAKLREVLAAS